MSKALWIIGLIIVAIGAILIIRSRGTVTVSPSPSSYITETISPSPSATSSLSPTPRIYGSPTPHHSPTPTPKRTTSLNAIITYTDSGFQPSVLTVKAGTTVMFKNNSSGPFRPASKNHPTHTLYPTSGGCVGSTFDACQDIPSGGSWNFKFDIKGTWHYHNHLNPSETGTVVVQ